jgi:hypothetical protein
MIRPFISFANHRKKNALSVAALKWVLFSNETTKSLLAVA